MNGLRAEIGERLRTQDNRSTRNPVFIVQQKRDKRWEFVTACLTEKGCQEYLDLDGHNLREPRIYAAGGYRNVEWELLRAYFMAEAFDLAAHLAHQAAWSEQTFGPGKRTAGVCDHIRKELLEVEADPDDSAEWIDVIILALDGAWRSGMTPDQIITGIVAKQRKNEARTWPDWRTADPDKAIEHDRSKDSP